MKKELKFAVSDSSAIPYDLDTYQFLCSHSIFSTKFNINYLPCIQDLFKCKITQIELKKIFDEALAKTESYWLKTDSTAKLVIKDKDCFVLSGLLNDANKEKLKKIETAWKNFFNRWGYHSSLMYDETQTRCKMTIMFEFSSQPEIQLEEDPVFAVSDQKLLLGNVLEISLAEFEGNQYIHIEDTFAKRTLYNLQVKVKDSGMIAKLIDLANASK